MLPMLLFPYFVLKLPVVSTVFTSNRVGRSATPPQPLKIFLLLRNICPNGRMYLFKLPNVFVEAHQVELVGVLLRLNPSARPE